MRVSRRMINSHAKTVAEILGRNPVHPFPARMSPGIAFDALQESESRLRVLDPMAGSGTVIAVARASGHEARGFDLDPLAVLLAQVWTRTIDPERVQSKAKEILNRAESIFEKRTSRQSYPVGSDEETRKFIRFWFDGHARRQLAALSTAIGRVRDVSVRDVLWCGFSRLIITKSAGASLAMDLSHSRPHKAFSSAPIKPFSRFVSAVESVVANCPHTRNGSVGPIAVVKLGDARRLRIPSDSIDLVLTSPPYLNAIDYMRCSKFSLVWMGYNLRQIREIRGESVGAEATSQEAMDSVWIQELIREMRLSTKLSPRNRALLSRYALDMSNALAEVSRVLRVDGRAVYVVGDSTIRGTYIRNSHIVRSVAERHGLQLSEKPRSRTLPANRRYLPPPKKGAANVIEGRMRREVVLAFKKPAA